MTMGEYLRRIDGGESRLSPLARPFNLDSSFSSSSNIFSPADLCLSDDSIFADDAFDLSFLTSDDHTCGLDVSLSEGGAATLPIGSQLYDQAAYASETKAGSGLNDQMRAVPKFIREKKDELVSELSSFPELNLRSAESQANSGPQVSLAIPVIPRSHFDSDVTLGEGCSTNFSPTSVLGAKGKTPAIDNVSTNNVYFADSDAKGQLHQTKDNAACFGKVMVNQTGQSINTGSINKSNFSTFSKLSKLQIQCPSGTNNDKLDLHSAKAIVLPEKSSVPSDQDDSDVDSPCWKGTQSTHTVVPTAKSMSLKRSGNDPNGSSGLNSSAPHSITAKAEKGLDKHVKDCGETISLSMQESPSSAFPSTYEDCNLIHPFKAVHLPPDISCAIKSPTCGETSKARGASILSQDADRSSNLVSQDSLSKVGSRLDCSNGIQASKKLDPLAPKFVPATAKLSTAVLEKHGERDDTVALKKSVPSTSALSPWLGSEVGIPENVNLETSGNALHGQHRLNPLAPEFLLAGTDRNLSCLENSRIAAGSVRALNTLVSSTSFVNGKDKVVDASELSSQHSLLKMQQQSSGACASRMEFTLPNELQGSSLLKSSDIDHPARVEDRLALSKQLVVGPKTTLSRKGPKDIECCLPFHTSEDATASFSSSVKALSDSSQTCSSPSLTPSPNMDVKRLLGTMHGLSELLVQGHSYSLDVQNEQEFVLVDNIIKNLNFYMRKRGQKHARKDSSRLCGSYNSNQWANPHKVLIRDLQPSGTNDMTVNIDRRSKEKYSMAFAEILQDFSGNGAFKGNGIAEVAPNSVLWGNRQLREQMNSQGLLYRSLWHKAEAELCLMKYNACLSQMEN